jgi:hypothetical protein
METGTAYSFYTNLPLRAVYFLYITASTACSVRFTLGKITSIKVGA